MRKHAIITLLAVATVVLAIASASAGSFSRASVAGAFDSRIVLVGGMGGGGGGISGGAGGMGGGAGGMGGAAGGMVGGAGGNIGGMGGGYFGGSMFRGPPVDFDQSWQEPWGSGASSANYTYQCVTPAGRCSFVAPAALRANSLRSGADCACSGGQARGQVQ